MFYKLLDKLLRLFFNGYQEITTTMTFRSEKEAKLAFEMFPQALFAAKMGYFSIANPLFIKNQRLGGKLIVMHPATLDGASIKHQVSGKYLSSSELFCQLYKLHSAMCLSTDRLGFPAPFPDKFRPQTIEAKLLGWESCVILGKNETILDLDNFPHYIG